jgi:hypothetical protein
MVAAVIPVLELRNAPRAALFGARMVILGREASVEIRAGCAPRRLMRVLREAFWEANAAVRLWAEATAAKVAGRRRWKSIVDVLSEGQFS